MGKSIRKSSIIFQVHSMGEIAGTQRTIIVIILIFTTIYIFVSIKHILIFKLNTFPFYL